MTAFTIAEGPQERESHHAWDGVLVLNDLAAWPRFEITGPIVNYRGRPPVDDTSDDNQGRIGATPNPGQPRAKDISYQITVVARSLPELRAGQGILGAAFAKGLSSGQMIVTPAGDWTGQQWAFLAKPQGNTPGAELFDARARPGPWQTGYTLTLRMHDPRFYAGAEGGLDYESVDLADGVASDCINQGTAPTDPVIEIAGPLSDADVTLTNVTTGKFLALHHVTVDSGDTLRVNFSAIGRSITLQSDGSGQRRMLRATYSTWWDSGIDGLTPGTNSIRVDGADATIQWLHAHWG